MNEQSSNSLVAPFSIVLILAGIGGWLLAQDFQDGIHQPPKISSFLFLGSAALLFAFLSHQKQTDRQWPIFQETEWVRGKPAALIGLPITSVLAVIPLILIPRLTLSDSHIWPALFWFLALCSGGFTIWQLDQKKHEAVGKIESAVWHIFPLAAILLLALFLRAYNISNIPYVLGGDEASQGLEAVRVLEGHISNPFTTGWLGVPTMSFYLNSITVGLFGRTIFGLRIVWAFVGTAAVLTTFLLVRRASNTTLGLMTAAFVAVYHYHIHFSRLGSNQIADTFFVSLALWLLVRSLDGTRLGKLDWYLTGTISALALYFYAGARLTPVLIIGILIYHLILNPKRVLSQWRGIATMIFGFLVVGGPMLQYAYRFPNDFNARLNQTGIIQSGWLEREIEIIGEPMITILIDQFRRAALLFNYYPDRTVWYGLDRPLLDPFFGTLFLLGLGYASLRILTSQQDRKFAPIVLWWWAGMLLGGMLTESPPSSQRLITLAIPACFMISLTINRLLDLIKDWASPYWRPAFILLMVTGFGVISSITYFNNFSPKRTYGGPNAYLATAVSAQIQADSTIGRAYVLGAPNIYWGFATFPYLAAGIIADDIEEPLTTPPSETVLAPNGSTIFILHRDRLNELELLINAYPQGIQTNIYHNENPRNLLGAVYIVSK